MLFKIIFLLAFYFIHGQDNVRWYNLPDYYLDSPVKSVNVAQSLYFAAVLDPTFKNVNYSLLANACYGKLIPAGSPLTRDEAAAVACYTYASPLSPAINYAVRNFSSVRLMIWSPYLQFLHTGVEKLVPVYKPAQLCRGDMFYYPTSPVGSVVTLPLSWSSSSGFCQFRAGDPLADNCTITRLYYFVNEKPIRNYSFYDTEEEYIMLPGTLGIISSIRPQDQQTCRIVNVFEIDASQVPITTNVTSLIPAVEPTANIRQNRPFMQIPSKWMLAAYARKIKNMTMLHVGNNQNID